MSHPVRYSNEKSALLKAIEERQGTNLLPGRIYVHTDDKGFKRLYILNFLQRVFMFFEDPKASRVGTMFGTLMLIVIVLNLIVFILSSLPGFQYQPDSCTEPVCENDSTLCANKTVCEPVPADWTVTVELICVIIFSIEYGFRILLVYNVPPRLCDVLVQKKKKSATMAAIFTTNRPSSKDELFAYAKGVLQETSNESGLILQAGNINEQKSRGMSTQGEVVFDPHVDSTKLVPKSIAGIALGFTPEGIPYVDRTQSMLADDDLLDELIVGEYKRQAVNGFIEENMDDDNGFVLPDMNQMVMSESDYTSVVDTENSLGPQGRHNAMFVTPSTEEVFKRGMGASGGPADNVDEDLLARRAKKMEIHHYKDTDGVEDLGKKSLRMDKAHKYSGKYKTLMYAVKVLNLIDLVAILPFYLELAVSGGNSSLSVVRVLRLARVFRIFKMGKGSSGVQLLGKTIWVSLPPLIILAFFITLGVVVFGALIYFAESGEYKVTADYPNGAFLVKDFWGDWVETTFTSISASCYWAVVTTTTTGYGEMVPYSEFGYMVSIFCAYYGVLLLALPITVIGNNFDKILNAQQGRDNEKFIYECLAGIVKSLDMEYRARSKLAPVPSAAYKMTLITAIISTFDSTKQTLLKDAISNANKEALTKKRMQKELDLDENISEKPVTSPERDLALNQKRKLKAIEEAHGRQLSEMMEAHSIHSQGSNDHHHDSDHGHHSGRGVSDIPHVDSSDILMNMHEATGMGSDEGGNPSSPNYLSQQNLNKSQVGKNDPSAINRAIVNDIASMKDLDLKKEKAERVNFAKEMAKEKDKGGKKKNKGKKGDNKGMAGVVWNNMPAMPSKNQANNKMLREVVGKHRPMGRTATEELALAQEELSMAIKEWSTLVNESPSKHEK